MHSACFAEPASIPHFWQIAVLSSAISALRACCNAACAAGPFQIAHATSQTTTQRIAPDTIAGSRVLCVGAILSSDMAVMCYLLFRVQSGDLRERSRTSVDVDMRVVNDFLPLVGFGLDEGAEVLRRAHGRFEAGLREAFLDVGLRHHIGNPVVEEIDD